MFIYNLNQIDVTANFTVDVYLSTSVVKLRLIYVNHFFFAQHYSTVAWKLMFL